MSTSVSKCLASNYYEHQSPSVLAVASTWPVIITNIKCIYNSSCDHQSPSPVFTSTMCINHRLFCCYHEQKFLWTYVICLFVSLKIHVLYQFPSSHLLSIVTVVNVHFSHHIICINVFVNIINFHQHLHYKFQSLSTSFVCSNLYIVVIVYIIHY